MTLLDVMIRPIVEIALLEDLGRGGDATAALMRHGERLETKFTARNSGIVAGMDAARIACTLVDSALVFVPRLADGARLEPGTVLAELKGPAGSVLAVERTALNFLTHLSGVATLTDAYVQAVSGSKARIAATRKTLPGLRALQKAAVVAGGGLPHRYGLDDAILIKDNHIAACGSVAEALRRARGAAGHMRVIEVEVDNLQQLEEALPYDPEIILLDNFALPDLRTAVALRGALRTKLEASGGVTLDTVRAIAETGVDVVSVGALTHSAPNLDIGLDV